MADCPPAVSAAVARETPQLTLALWLDYTALQWQQLPQQLHQQVIPYVLEANVVT